MKKIANKQFVCSPMKRHYMTTAASNAATALSMAKEINGVVDGDRTVQAIVRAINELSLGLIDRCEELAAAAPEVAAEGVDRTPKP